LELTISLVAYRQGRKIFPPKEETLCEK